MDKAHFTCIVFGEILYDCFPDHTCLGGASLNFAWNLRQLGFPVAMVSAVGCDELGQQARGFLQRTDIDQQWVTDRVGAYGHGRCINRRWPALLHHPRRRGLGLYRN